MCIVVLTAYNYDFPSTLHLHFISAIMKMTATLLFLHQSFIDSNFRIYFMCRHKILKLKPKDCPKKCYPKLLKEIVLLFGKHKNFNQKKFTKVDFYLSLIQFRNWPVITFVHICNVVSLHWYGLLLHKLSYNEQ